MEELYYATQNLKRILRSADKNGWNDELTTQLQHNLTTVSTWGAKYAAEETFTFVVALPMTITLNPTEKVVEMIDDYYKSVSSRFN